MTDIRHRLARGRTGWRDYRRESAATCALKSAAALRRHGRAAALRKFADKKAEGREAFEASLRMGAS
jgi:hypothetical protein